MLDPADASGIVAPMDLGTLEQQFRPPGWHAAAGYAAFVICCAVALGGYWLWLAPPKALEGVDLLFAPIAAMAASALSPYLFRFARSAQWRGLKVHAEGLHFIHAGAAGRVRFGDIRHVEHAAVKAKVPLGGGDFGLGSVPVGYFHSLHVHCGSPERELRYEHDSGRRDERFVELCERITGIVVERWERELAENGGLLWGDIRFLPEEFEAEATGGFFKKGTRRTFRYEELVEVGADLDGNPMLRMRDGAKIPLAKQPTRDRTVALALWQRLAANATGTQEPPQR